MPKLFSKLKEHYQVSKSQIEHLAVSQMDNLLNLTGRNGSTIDL